MLRLILLVALSVVALGCRGPASTGPVIKVGLLAPFEGAYRQIGYHLLPAARLAVQEAQDAGRLRGVHVEWVVLDTHGDPQLARQRARELALDPDIVAVIGPAFPETVAVAVPLLESLSIPVWPLVIAELPDIPERPLLPSAGAAALAAAEEMPEPWFYVDAAPPDPAFVAAYTDLTGAPPWPLDAAAYRATAAALAALPCRTGVPCSADWQPSQALYRGAAGRFPGELVRPLSPGG